MKLTKNLYTLALLFSNNLVAAQIYKCISDSGEVKYQSKECNGNEKSKVMTIKPVPKSVVNKPKLKHVVKNTSYDKYPNALEESRIKKNQHQKQKCAMLQRKFRTEEKKVIDRCKRNLDVFCNLPAVTIEQNERKKAIHQISHSRGRGTVRIPASSPVETVQQELKSNGCR